MQKADTQEPDDFEIIDKTEMDSANDPQEGEKFELPSKQPNTPLIEAKKQREMSVVETEQLVRKEVV